MLTSHSNNLWTLPKHLLSIIQKHSQTSPTPDNVRTLTCNCWPFWSLSTCRSNDFWDWIRNHEKVCFPHLRATSYYRMAYCKEYLYIHMSTYGYWKFTEAPTPFPHLPALAWSRVLRIIPLPQQHGNHNVIRAWWDPAGLLSVVIEQQLVQLFMKNLIVVSLLLYIGIEQTFPGIDDKPVSDMVFCEALQFNTMCTWNIQHKALLLMVWKWTPVINRSWSQTT